MNSEISITLSKPVIYQKSKKPGVHFFIQQAGGAIRFPKYHCRIVNFDKTTEDCKNYKAPYYQASNKIEGEAFEKKLYTMENDIYNQLEYFRKNESVFKEFHPNLPLEKGSFFVTYKSNKNIPVGLYTKKKIAMNGGSKNEDVGAFAIIDRLNTKQAASELVSKEGLIILYAKIGSIFVYEKEGKLRYYLRLYLSEDNFRFREDVSSIERFEKTDDADLYSDEGEVNNESDSIYSHTSEPILPVESDADLDYRDVI